GPFQSAWDTLNDDLNTPGALGGLFTGLKESSALSGEDAAKALAAFNRVLRALGITLPEEQEVVEAPGHILALADERWQARLGRNWAKSDLLRDQLLEDGWVVKDGKDGYELSPRE
ncbi:MAG: DALR domain-containing protein, partial [Verrucomicrobiales bacterium]